MLLAITIQKMICSRCLQRASSRRSFIPISRVFSSSARVLEPAAPAADQPSSNPNHIGVNLRSAKAHSVEPIISSVPAGTPLKGINYFKNQNDPVALPENEYPDWLWRCLDVKKKEDGDDTMDADLFAKSKKLRRKAAKRQRKLELARLASGDLSLLDPKVPLTQQSIDLPSNEEGTLGGAIEADEKRTELKVAMRSERRAKIKEKNYLKSV